MGALVRGATARPDGRRRSAWSSARAGWARGVANQAIFHLSQFTLLQHDFERTRQQPRPLVLPRPAGDAGDAGVRRVLRRRCARGTAEIDRVQVTNREMEGARARRRGSPPRRSTDPDRHRPGRLPPARRGRPAPRARTRLGLPGSAFVVGSFQKDGVGWGEGLEPKLIKGPDVLLAVAERSRRDASRAPLPAHRPGPRLRPRGARAPRHPVPPPSAARRRRGRGDVPGDRRLPRRLARRGRAACGARVDGDARAARDDAGRAGGRPRAARRERLDGRARGRRRARRRDRATSRRRRDRRARPRPRRRARASPRRTRTSRYGRAGGRCSRAS